MTAATPSRAASRTQRISALDFTKGALVLIMVLYHWLNYFVGLQGSYYRYLRFLPPSFIFITGFLISHVYLSRYLVTDRHVPGRLLVRGIKLLGIFTALNVLISVFLPQSYGGRLSLRNLDVSSLTSIYITGDFSGGRSVAFFVLVPISYLLLLSAGLLILCRFYRHSFHLTTVVFLTAAFLLGSAGWQSGNLMLLSIGMLGVSLGHLPMPQIDRVLRNAFLLGSAYLLYILAVTWWDTTDLLGIIGVCVTVAVIYRIGTGIGDSGWIQRATILLGKYSLFGYIAQIAILRLMQRSLQNVQWGPGLLALSFLGAVILTLAAVELAHVGRARSPFVNRLYSAVFA